jgi:hypothetical protein
MPDMPPVIVEKMRRQKLAGSPLDLAELRAVCSTTAPTEHFDLRLYHLRLLARTGGLTLDELEERPLMEAVYDFLQHPRA